MLIQSLQVDLERALMTSKETDFLLQEADLKMLRMEEREHIAEEERKVEEKEGEERNKREEMERERERDRQQSQVFVFLVADGREIVRGAGKRLEPVDSPMWSQLTLVSD